MNPLYHIKKITNRLKIFNYYLIAVLVVLLLNKDSIAKTNSSHSNNTKHNNTLKSSKNINSNNPIRSNNLTHSSNPNSNFFSTKAKHALLLDYSSGQILFDYKSDEQMTPSSMTKIMTSYLVFEAIENGWLKFTDKFKVSKKAWSMGGSKMFTKIHDEIMVEDLLKGIIAQSGNDACIVLAEGMYGDEEVFVQHMNIKAKELNMKGTNFKNASGWYADGHFITARDLAKLTIALINDFPQYYHYFSMKEFTYNGIKQQNKNILLGKKGVDGVKTGMTDSGGYGIVASAKNGNSRIIAIINGLNSEKEREVEAWRLINYGINNFNEIVVFRPGDKVVETEVVYGNAPTLELTVPNEVTYYMPKTIKNNEIEIKIKYKKNLRAPIKHGERIGEMVIQQNNINGTNIIMPLIAKHSVGNANFIQRIIQNIQNVVS